MGIVGKEAAVEGGEVYKILTVFRVEKGKMLLLVGK